MSIISVQLKGAPSAKIRSDSTAGSSRAAYEDGHYP